MALSRFLQLTVCWKVNVPEANNPYYYNMKIKAIAD